MKTLLIYFLPLLVLIWPFIEQQKYRDGFKVITTPRSGEHYLAKSHVQVVKYLRETNRQNYSFSNKLLKDDGAYQRITEIAWPIRNRKNSETLIYSLQESIPNKCKPIFRGNYDFGIAQCN